MRYIAHTEADIREMLKCIGVHDVDALFEHIPEEYRLNRPLCLPAALSEPELMSHMAALARSNQPHDRQLSFLGAGVYRHYSPAVIDQLLLRGEFLTAYTPYQPELSQGTLQAIFEFQTMIAELLGTEVANASLYDGSTAAAEAVLMARRLTRRQRCLVSLGVHPEYREVAWAYNEGTHGQLDYVPLDTNGTTDFVNASEQLDKDVACIVVAQPNFLGVVEDIAAWQQLAQTHGAMLVVVVTEPSAFAIFEAPGLCGADIVAGEGQALGLAPNVGGPHCGIFGARAAHVRQMPGRLCGRTLDAAGRPGFVLTLSTREQHIRREKATSNICTNQGLMALAVGMYLTWAGPLGLERVARINLARSEALKQKVAAIPGFSIRYPDSTTYNEFVLQTPMNADSLAGLLHDDGIAPGLPLGRYYSQLSDCLLVNVTEVHSESDLDRLCAAFAAATSERPRI